MSAEKSESLVLNSVPFSNTSLIVTLYTREFGKFSALAKGARREKNPFDNGLDIMARLTTIHYPRKEGLQLLTQAGLQRWFRVDRNNLSALYAGYYVVELLDDFTAEFDPCPELFDLTDQTLALLCARVPVWRTLTRFQWQLLRINGVQPRFDGCVLCGKPRGAGTAQTVDILEGGLICPDCLAQKNQESAIGSSVGSAFGPAIGSARQTTRRKYLPGTRVNSVVTVSNPVLELTRLFIDPKSSLWTKVKPTDGNLRELRAFTDLFVAHVLGWKPKMQQFSRLFI